MAPFQLDDFLPYQLAVIASRVSKDFSEIYKEQFGLSVPEWRAMAQLGNATTPLSVRDLCALTELEKSKVSRAITRLEARGFVAKTEAKNDRRLVAVQLTNQGKDVITELAPLAEHFQQELIVRLGDKGPLFRSALNDLLVQAK